MLTTRSSAIAIAVLTAGAALALDTAPASAGGHGGGGREKSTARITSTRTKPGRAQPGGGGGGGGGGGKPAPMPCPADAVCGETTAGDAPAAPVMIPATQVAAQARAEIQLPEVHINTAPANRTYVGLRTGLWVDGFHRVDPGLTLGGTTVTLHARPLDVTWSMGDGTVICKTAGSRSGKTCGYTYSKSSAHRANGKYEITATITWYVSWTCVGGLCDADGGDWAPDSTEWRADQADLAVGEVQTESRPG
jgi:hypothetical protein